MIPSVPSPVFLLKMVLFLSSIKSTRPCNSYNCTPSTFLGMIFLSLAVGIKCHHFCDSVFILSLNNCLFFHWSGLKFVLNIHEIPMIICNMYIRNYLLRMLYVDFVCIISTLNRSCLGAPTGCSDSAPVIT